MGRTVGGPASNERTSPSPLQSLRQKYGGGLTPLLPRATPACASALPQGYSAYARQPEHTPIFPRV